MPSPRALLRAKFVEWFTIGELDRFVADHFEGARGTIPDRGTEDRAEALLGWLQREGRMAEVWLALREVRAERCAQIDELEAAWKASPRADDRITAWLTTYQATLEALFKAKLRGNPMWSVMLDPLDLLVRERLARADEDAKKAAFVGPLDLALDVVEPRVALIADGGSGKSTIILELATRMAKAALSESSAPIPLFMQLNHFDSDERAFDGMLDGIAAAAGLDPQVMRELWNSDRPCCFILDGLNEVRVAYRDSCRSAIQQLAQRKHRCIVTSRPTADVDRLVQSLRASVLEVVPLTKDQVRTVLETRNVVAADLDRISELAETPFLVSAIIRIYEGAARSRLPTTVPQLYRLLIDDYLFAKREEEVASTSYDYERVKRPILAELALRMRRDGLTRIVEDDALMSSLKQRLADISARYEGEVDVMPKTFVAKGLLDEIVANGVLTRANGTLEFWHESVLDYFAAVGLDSSKVDEIVPLVPPLIWRRLQPREGEVRAPGAFGETLAMYVGLSGKPSAALAALAERNPLVAARCIGNAGLQHDPAVRPIIEEWIALLDHPHQTRRWVACQCLQRAEAVDEVAGHKLVRLASANTAMMRAASNALATCRHPAPIEALIDAFLTGARGILLDRELVRMRSPLLVMALLRRATECLDDEQRDAIHRVVGAMPKELVEEVVRRSLDPSAEAALAAIPRKRPLLTKIASLRAKATKEREADRANRERMSLTSSDELRVALKSIDESERFVALEILDERDTLVVDDLFTLALADPARRVRERAAIAFGTIPPPEWFAAWAERLEDPASDDSARLPLLPLARYLGDQSLDVLEAFFARAPQIARSSFIAALGAIGSDRSLSRLAKLADAGDESVVRAIATSGHPMARQLLLRALEQSTSSDRASMATLLTMALREFDAADDIRRTIVRLLDGPEDKHALAAQMFLAHAQVTGRAFQDVAMRLAASADPALRLHGVRSLSDEASADVRASLLRVCIEEQDRRVWLAACESFRDICDDTDIARLRERRTDPDPAIRVRVVGALAHLQELAVLGDLQAATADADAEVRAAAAAGMHSLGETLSSELIDQLVTIAKGDASSFMHEQAAEVLRSLDPT